MVRNSDRSPNFEADWADALTGVACIPVATLSEGFEQPAAMLSKK